MGVHIYGSSIVVKPMSVGNKGGMLQRRGQHEPFVPTYIICT